MSGSITVRRLGSAVAGALVPGAHKDGGLAVLAATIAGAARSLGVSGQDIGLAIVSEQAIGRLNAQHRGKRGATDILSFAFEDPEGEGVVDGEPVTLGDMFLCPAVVARDAGAAGPDSPMPADAAEAILVHGMVHLRGFDHDNDADAAAMQAEETRVLAALKSLAPTAHHIAAIASYGPPADESDPGHPQWLHVEWEALPRR